MIQRVHRSPYVQCQTAEALVLPCFVDQNHWSAMLPQGRASHCLYYDRAQRLRRGGGGGHSAISPGNPTLRSVHGP